MREKTGIQLHSFACAALANRTGAVRSAHLLIARPTRMHRTAQSSMWPPQVEVGMRAMRAAPSISAASASWSSLVKHIARPHQRLALNARRAATMPSSRNRLRGESPRFIGAFLLSLGMLSLPSNGSASIDSVLIGLFCCASSSASRRGVDARSSSSDIVSRASGPDMLDIFSETRR